MKLTIAGCGDAFGSGGRLQTCYHVAASNTNFLIDCGATALIALDRLGLDTNRISTIFISHLHGDHFAGLVWWLLHAQHVARRTVPLTITGPEGIEARFVTAAEALFSGSTSTKPRFDMRFVEYALGEPLAVNGIRVTAHEVVHPSGAPSCGLRIEADGRVIGFSGDTEWTENLIPIARNSDLFIAECYAYDAPVRYHSSWAVLQQQMSRLAAKRLMLTHMGPDMLAHLDAITDPRVILAEDGLVIDI